MIRHIVVPLDGTAFGEFALPYAVHLARRARATLELVHVRPDIALDAEGCDVGPLVEGADPHEPLEHGRTWLHIRARALAATSGLSVLPCMAYGNPEEALCEEIAAARADLVVMATHARGGLSRARRGSISDAVVRRSGVPVLLLRPPSETAAPPANPRFRRVLVALDGSRYSELILPHVRTLCRLTGALPQLMHVVVPLPASTPAGLRDEVEATQRRAASEAYLDRVARELLPSTGPVAATAVIDRRPAAMIEASASDPAIDVVAIATRGRSGLLRLLLGSTGDRVLRRTTKAVLLYRPDAAALLQGVFAAYDARTVGVTAGVSVS